MRHSIYLFLGLTLFILMLSSCKSDEEPITDSSAKLEFSLDTLRFDTVFTELGSATRYIRVYNRNNKPIIVSEIALEDGANSPFRINVDGIPGAVAKDVEIPANDSIYIFTEVTVDPDQPLSESPFVITENLLFETNGNDQKVVLEAWGQNANYIPSRFSAGTFSLLSCDLGEVVWDDPKPYVIYGVLFIDSCTLNIPSGTEIYVHGGLAIGEDADANLFTYNDGIIIVQPQGRLDINGTIDEPVIIQGDRLESPFAEEPGQWSGIRLLSDDNEMDYTEIKNSLYGVYLDSSAELSIKNSRIYNTSGPGIFASNAKVDAENSLFYNNAGRALQLSFGGIYEFDYCTMANYGFDSPAVSLSNGRCLDAFCGTFETNPIIANFQNCIISGSRSDELTVTDFYDGMNPLGLRLDFINCILKLEDLLDPEESGFDDFLGDYTVDCINVSFSDVLFADPNEGNYYLDTLSVAENQAKVLNDIQKDIEDKPRDSTNPDIGCFEYQYE